MDKGSSNTAGRQASDGTKKKYVPPETQKHEPLNIVRGSGSEVSLYLGGLYVECSLYYYY